MLIRNRGILVLLALLTVGASPTIGSEAPGEPPASESFDLAHEHFRTGRRLQRLHRNTSASQTELMAAFDGYRGVLKADPGSKTAARALYMSGSTKLFLDQPEEAIAIYEQVVERFPGDRYYVAKSLVKKASVEKNSLEPEAARSTLRRYRGEFPDLGPKDLRKDVKRIESSLATIGKLAPPVEAARWFNAPDNGPTGGAAVSVLYFWATWCPNCKKEVDFVNGLWSRYENRGLRFVGVTKNTRGQTDETVEAYIEAHGFTFPVAVDAEGRTSRALSVASVPSAVVIDRKGRVRWHDHPAALSDGVLERLLAADDAENR